MKTLQYAAIVLSVLVFGGCGPSDPDFVKPQDISGVWSGQKTNPGEMMTFQYQMKLTLTQNGSQVTGEARSASGAGPFSEDIVYDVNGTYDQATGVFTMGSIALVFIDDNTMTSNGEVNGYHYYFKRQ